MEKKLLETVNKMITEAAREFHSNGDKWTPAHERNIAKIHGALEMLETATGKKYVFNENGIQERSNA